MSDFSVNNFEGSGVSFNSVFSIGDSLPTNNEVSFESHDGGSFSGVEHGEGFIEVTHEVGEEIINSLGGGGVNEIFV